MPVKIILGCHRVDKPSVEIHWKEKKEFQKIYLKGSERDPTATSTTVHSSISHQKEEATQLSPICKMWSKQATEYYSALVTRGEGVTKATTWWSCRHYAKRNKPDTKQQRAFDSTYMRPENSRFIETESRTEVTRGWGGAGELAAVWDDENHFWKSMVIMVAQQCECTKPHWAINLKIVKMGNFILHIFYHNKKR